MHQELSTLLCSRLLFACPPCLPAEEAEAFEQHPEYEELWSYGGTDADEDLLYQPPGSSNPGTGHSPEHKQPRSRRGKDAGGSSAALRQGSGSSKGTGGSSSGTGGSTLAAGGRQQAAGSKSALGTQTSSVLHEASMLMERWLRDDSQVQTASLNYMRFNAAMSHSLAVTAAATLVRNARQEYVELRNAAREDPDTGGSMHLLLRALCLLYGQPGPQGAAPAGQARQLCVMNLSCLSKFYCAELQELAAAAKEGMEQAKALLERLQNKSLPGSRSPKMHDA